MKKRSEYLDDLTTRINKISIVDIISRYMDVKQEGSNFTGVCPFHTTKTTGSFMISPQLNIFRCFSCGISGDAIDFVSELLNIGFIEAVSTIGQDYGLISDDEYEKYFNKKTYNNRIKRRKKKYTPVEFKKETLVEVANIQILNAVYSAFLNQLDLKDYHKSYLIQKRKISESRIQEVQYKSIRSDMEVSKVVNGMQRTLKKQGINSLKGVPGFYVHDSKWTFRPTNGLIMPIYNEEGLIQALQINNDDQSDGLKYFWFTSSFAHSGNKKYSLGCSPGQPMDILYPSIDRYPNCLFITEGKFKAEILSQVWGFKTISVQGVTNWRGIEDKIKFIENKELTKIDNIFVAFDSDISFKFQVFEQLIKMTDSIEKNVNINNICYLYWNHELGKGIDDLIINNRNIKKDKLIRRLNKHNVDALYNLKLNNVSKKFPNLEKSKQKTKAVKLAFESIA